MTKTKTSCIYTYHVEAANFTVIHEVQGAKTVDIMASYYEPSLACIPEETPELEMVEVKSKTPAAETIVELDMMEEAEK